MFFTLNFSLKYCINRWAKYFTFSVKCRLHPAFDRKVTLVLRFSILWHQLTIVELRWINRLRKRRQPMPITVPSLPVKKQKSQPKRTNVTPIEPKRSRSKSSTKKPVTKITEIRALSKIQLPEIPVQNNSSQFTPSRLGRSTMVTSG